MNSVIEKGEDFSQKLITLLYYLIHSLLHFYCLFCYLIQSFYYLIYFVFVIDPSGP